MKLLSCCICTCSRWTWINLAGHGSGLPLPAFLLEHDEVAADLLEDDGFPFARDDRYTFQST